jgi:hypothetical protein
LAISNDALTPSVSDNPISKNFAHANAGLANLHGHTHSNPHSNGYNSHIHGNFRETYQVQESIDKEVEEFKAVLKNETIYAHQVKKVKPKISDEWIQYISSAQN